MLCRSLTTAVICAGVAASSADLSHEFVPVDSTTVLRGEDPLVPDFNDGSYYVYDLIVTATDRRPGRADDWVGTGVEAAIDGPAEFFQHPGGDHVPPDPDLFGPYPALEFDSYLAGAPGILPGIAELVSEPTYLRAAWFDTFDHGNGTYSIARFGIHWLGDEPTLLTVVGGSGGRDDEGAPWLFDFAVTIPEPSMLMLLGVGVTAVVRRR